MQVKVNGASGAVLDYLVAKCEGVPYSITHGYKGSAYGPIVTPVFTPSTDWAQGGPIIDRELIRVIAPTVRGVDWVARIKQGLPSNMNGWFEKYGPTPLIAAMRCYVASKMGEEVEVPDELV